MSRSEPRGVDVGAAHGALLDRVEERADPRGPGEERLGGCRTELGAHSRPIPGAGARRRERHRSGPASRWPPSGLPAAGARQATRTAAPARRRTERTARSGRRRRERRRASSRRPRSCGRRPGARRGSTPTLPAPAPGELGLRRRRHPAQQCQRRCHGRGLITGQRTIHRLEDGGQIVRTVRRLRTGPPASVRKARPCVAARNVGVAGQPREDLAGTARHGAENRHPHPGIRPVADRQRGERASTVSSRAAHRVKTPPGNGPVGSGSPAICSSRS